MAYPKTTIQIELTSEECGELERIARSFAIPHRTVIRARVILGLADGGTVSGVARHVGLQRRIVRKWGQRFVRKRLCGLDDGARSGRPARFSP